MCFFTLWKVHIWKYQDPSCNRSICTFNCYDSCIWMLQVLLYIPFHLPTTQSLECHSCFNTNTREECFITKKSCDPSFVCYVETSQFTNGEEEHSDHASEDQVLVMYTMGCKHHRLCRDKTTQRQSQYGYAITSVECCCDSFCDSADGVGESRFESCPRLWPNNTEVPDSIASGIKPGILIYMLCFVYLRSIVW